MPNDQCITELCALKLCVKVADLLLVTVIGKVLVLCKKNSSNVQPFV